jgi:hypothetical protein
MEKTQETLKNQSEKEWTDSFLESLSNKERKSDEFARSHLGMSFDLVKSVGFIEWKKQQK